MKRASAAHSPSFDLHPLEPRTLCAADLVPGGISMLAYQDPPTGTVSRPVLFSIANIGDTAAPAGTQIAFYASRNGILDGSDRLLRTSTLTAPLAPGERLTFTKSIQFPQGMDDGSYRLIERVDPQSQVDESDETNNNLPTTSFEISLPPRIGSLTASKIIIRPSSVLTLTVHDVGGVDASGGQILIYRVNGEANDQYPEYSPKVLVGAATSTGHGEFSLTFTVDPSWVVYNNAFIAIAQKQTASVAKVLHIPGRRVPLPSVGSFSFSPTPLIRGQALTFTASNVSPDAESISVYFDANLNNTFELPYNGNYATNPDRWLFFSGPWNHWTTTFTVPDWFPSAPTKMFIVVFSHGTAVSQTYSTQLSAQG